ncbi:hypothetical protein NFI96_011431 [Prochilodus magdalenae]|nr:hypothetical protein NFI96_011431 [Prochilodus magdalenae]
MCSTYTSDVCPSKAETRCLKSLIWGSLFSLLVIQFHEFLFLSGGASKINIPCLNGLKYIQNGENVNLTCFFSSTDASATAWFKQTPGEKPLLIASAFRAATVTYHNGFKESGRFSASREQGSFNLSISNAEPSDSATYYCSVAYYTDIALLDCTVLVLKGSPSRLSAVLQHPVSDPVELGGDTTLQCSVLTDTSAGGHSVYWFRHGSGESHPGIIYTHGNRSDQCKSSSETNSSTQSCVYKLPKRNLSLSDAGTYYCAVLMCGEIILGNGTKLDFVGDATKTPCLHGVKYIHGGGNIHLDCYFQPVDPAATAWLKQTPGEKPLLIASAFGALQVKYHNGFEKSGRFNAERDQSSFNLSISNAEPSDSATYYCVFAYYTDVTLSECTVVVFKGSPSRLSGVLQHPVSGPVELGGDTTLQCSVLTDTSAGEHSVYWFRHGSGESHPGIIYTHGNRSDQCKSSSETNSSTQSCVYKLPKRNLSLSDAGTYYCAVLMCGEIVFGRGTKLDFVEKSVLDPTIICLAASNIISLLLVLFLCRKLHNRHKDAAEGHAFQVNQAEDADILNYAALSFAQSSSSRKNRTKNSSDQPVYSQIHIRGQVDITCLDGQKVVQAGENISLTCSTSSTYLSAIAWFKETLLIASAFSSTPQYHNDFEKSGRFIALREQSSLTLNISNAEPSDSATYYCSVTEYTDVALLGCTVLVLKGSPSRLSAVLQHPVSDPVELGGDTTLQCSVLTDTSAGEHSVYWFRHGSGESHPGIIYTHGNRSDQCKSSSETDSSTQSCVYKLPKRNLSLSDAGTYYCAVLMCGEIIFGSGTKLDFVEEGALVPAVLGLAAFSIISIAVVLFLFRKLHSSHSKGSTLKTDIQCLNGLKYADDGGTIHLNCFLSSTDVSVTAWFRQTPGEKPLLIASTFHTAKIKYHDEFERSGRFHAVTDKSSFNLTISNAEPSDSATYYCAMADYTNIALSACTVLVLKDSSSRLYTVLQHPVSAPVELGGDTTLQCSVLTDTSAGEHSVYWFRHGSGESHPGIIYTHGNRSDQCKSSSETDSSTQSCVYKLPKRNLSLSDAGTYYCAVAACGQILFGNGTKLDFVGKIKYLKCLKLSSRPKEISQHQNLCQTTVALINSFILHHK